jgi:dephospho-CoA kinase
MSLKYKNGIVLTGGIATGKSTVASLLRMYGYTIIDADEIVHNVLHLHAKDIDLMFDGVVEDGKVNRKKLGVIVFNDKIKLGILERFLHPIIKQEILKEANDLETFGIPYFVDIPLFFEKKNYDEFEKVLVIYTPYKIQLERLMDRNSFSKEEAQKRINLQMNIEEKVKKADFQIDNSGSLKHLQEEVDRFVKSIK